MQLITSAQNLTNAWADLGGQVEMVKNSKTAIWIVLDINSSENARLRVLAQRYKNDTKEYVLPIKVVGSSDVKVQDEYFEFNDDADQNVILEIDTAGLIPYLQFQVMAGTVGATAGQIDEADLTFLNL